MIKIAFFDVDGTLLRLGHKELSANTAAALRQLHQNGIILCMATGRSYTGVPHFDGIDFDVLLTFNGSFVTAGNDIIFKNPINEHDKYQIISNLKQMNRAIAISNEHMIVTNGTDPDLEQYFAFGSEKLKIADNFDEISRTDIYQIMCSCQKDEHSQILSGAPHSQITAWWDKAVDIIPLNSGKGNAVAAVLRHYGFSKDEAIAFGDGHNDIEMLEAVGIGVAMGNGEDELKDQATHVTDTNNQNGIAKALSHYGLIHFETENSFTSDDGNFNKVKDFHHLMDGSTNDMPRVYGIEEAGHRADFKLEEIVEFLYASSGGDKRVFGQAVLDLHAALDKAALKVSSKEHSESTMVGQVDALTDLLYLTYGSFVLMGVDPKPFFDTVHEANMGKIFPDGKAHFDPVTHKILKPSDWEERFAPEPHIKRELDRQIQKSLQRNK